MKNARMTIWLVVLVAIMVTNQGFGWTQFNDGGTYDIDYEVNDVWVDYSAPNMQTTVNLINGGVISPGKLNGYNDSKINISGGKAGVVNAYDNSQVTMNSGISRLYAYDNSQVTMNNCGMSSLYAYDNSQVTINNGSLANLYAFHDSEIALNGVGTRAISGYLNLQNNAQLVMSGGRVNCLHMEDNSKVIMSGGDVYHHSLRIDDSSILALDGSSFRIDGVPFTSGEITSILRGSYSDDPYRWLTGTLASGEMINYGFQIGNNAKIVLVPEPTTILLLGLGGLAVFKRKSVL